MPSWLDIRRRIRAVKSTQQITKAMKMVAASKLRRAQDRIQQARPFATQMLRVLNSLAGRVDPAAHPLLDRKSTRLNSSHSQISYAVFCLKKKKKKKKNKKKQYKN